MKHLYGNRFPDMIFYKFLPAFPNILKLIDGED